MKKDSGGYSAVIGIVRKLDGSQKVIVMMDGTKITIEEIMNVSGAMFRSIEDLFA